MSAVAGRVLIIPKGAYVAGTTYNMLDLVKYNSKSFLAKRTNTNVTPVDGADWMELTNDGVTSFNGRTGAVSPASGDYDITDMGDVNITSPTDGQGLRYNAQSGKWENGDAASAVSNLTDVDLTNLADGQILKYNSTAQKWENVDEKGHTIQNASGTAQTQRASLQYKDAFVSDDSVNGRTVVENVKEVSPADYDSTTDEGIIVTDDGNDALIGAVSDDYVEVTADGDKTYATLLNEIATEMDFSKVRDNAYLATILANGNKNISVLRANYGTSVTFFQGLSESTGARIRTYYIEDSNSQFEESTGSSYSDKSTTKPTNGTVIRLYYGNKKATVDLQTTANRCVTSDGETVQSNLNRLNYSSIINTGRLSYTNCTYVDGGYSVIGNVVIVNIRVKVTEDGHIGINNLPRPKTINNKATVGVNVFRIQQDKASQLYAYMLGINQTTAMIATKDVTLAADEEYSFSAVYVSDYAS